MYPNFSNKSTFIVIYLFCIVLSGCANKPTLNDQLFGTAYRAALMEQEAVNEDFNNSLISRTTDGNAMKSAVDRYQKSFETIPLPINIFNIGVGTSSSTSTLR